MFGFIKNINTVTYKAKEKLVKISVNMSLV